MMVKKLSMVVLIMVMILVGCNPEGQSSVEVSVRMADSSTSLGLEQIPYVVQASDSTLILFDALTNATINEFVLPDEEMEIRGPIQQLENGHLGVFGITGLGDGFFAEDSDVTMILYILDHELNLLDSLSITDEQLMMSSRNSAILYDPDNWLIFYPGWLDLNSGGWSKSVYVYHANDHETSLFFELDEGLFPADLQLISMNSLGFFASDIQEGNHMVYYGTFDLGTEEKQLFPVELTDFHTGQSVVHDHYVVFNENLAPDSRSEIIVLNLITGVTQTLQLDGNESGFGNATIFGDGRLILAHHSEGGSNEIRVRVYEMQSLNILLEHEMPIASLEFQEGEEVVFIEHISIDEGLYALVIGISVWEGRDEGHSTENMRFHTEFILIEEME